MHSIVNIFEHTRKAARLNQTEMAKLLGVTKSAYSEWLKLEVCPNGNVIIAFAMAFKNIDMNDVLRHPDVAEHRTKISEKQNDDYTQSDLIELISQVPKLKYKAVYHMMQALIDL